MQLDIHVATRQIWTLDASLHASKGPTLQLGQKENNQIRGTEFAISNGTNTAGNFCKR